MRWLAFARYTAFRVCRNDRGHPPEQMVRFTPIEGAARSRTWMIIQYPDLR